jgi:hypothetical protein
MPVRNQKSSAVAKTRVLSPNDAIDDGGMGIPLDLLEDGTPDVSSRVEFIVKIADNRAVLARQDLFSKVKYINEGDGTATERSFPMGALRLETVMLVLTGWNITPDEKSAPYPITHNNVLDHVKPDEMQWLYDRIIDMNVAWGGSGEG